jgi:hypothetical protein
MQKKSTFLLKNLHMSEICCTFAAQKLKQQKQTIMEAALRKPVMQYAGTISDQKWDSLHTINELDASLKNIIYKERLIEPDWKEHPMRPWSEVYDELCCEVGHAYGLSDIREA